MNKTLAYYELGGVLCLAVVTSVIFWLSDLDIQLARLFYDPDNILEHWPLKQMPFVKIMFDYAFEFVLSLGILAFSVFFASFLFPKCRAWRFQSLYIVLVIALGPGLVVNLIVKDHWGRPRPVHIHEFGGQYDYIPPAKIGNTPDKSFVCGHCSVGYAFFAVYFLAQNHKLIYFLLTLSFAWSMGFTRMAAGGHFLSDILWSGYLVFMVAYGLYYGWYRRIARHSQAIDR
jgi:membrane-associated PAP2 superfamily phosphatase